RIWFLTLAVVGALNAAIGAAYYLKIVGVMFFQPATAPAPAGKGGTGALAAMVTCGVLVVGVGVSINNHHYVFAGIFSQPQREDVINRNIEQSRPQDILFAQLRAFNCLFDFLGQRRNIKLAQFMTGLSVSHRTCVTQRVVIKK
ncbi:MAG TPA: hypothetical protein PK012_09635, partial [Blastocatellia bacterium]|nr:hypothetical protein [Blastocatellia bacterium]